MLHAVCGADLKTKTLVQGEFNPSLPVSIDDVGVSRDTVFHEIRPGELVLKPAISLKKSEKLGGLPQNDSSNNAGRMLRYWYHFKPKHLVNDGAP